MMMQPAIPPESQAQITSILIRKDSLIAIDDKNCRVGGWLNKKHIR